MWHTSSDGRNLKAHSEGPDNLVQGVAMLQDAESDNTDEKVFRGC